MGAPTIWQENAARFALTREQLDAQLDTRRREGIRQVLDHLVANQSDGRRRAHYLLQRSFLDQLRIAGLENAGFPIGPRATELPGVVRLRTGGRHAAHTLERTIR